LHATSNQEATIVRLALKIIFGLLIAALAGDSFAQAPIVKVKPVYPSAAVEQRITGHVTVEFTIGEGGIVRDPVVVESSAQIFDDAALSALRKWRYAKDAAGSNLSETIEFTTADLEVELANRGQRSSNPQKR
jgi:TonB family protein